MSRRVSRAVPTSACHSPVVAQQDPGVVGRRQLRQMLRDDVADRFEIERAAERLPEGDEALHLGGARARLQRVGFRRGGARLGLHPLALLMEEKHAGQDDQHRHQRQAGALFDVARHVQQIADRPREQHDHGDREAAEQHAVLPGHEIHGIDRTVAQSAGTR